MGRDTDGLSSTSDRLDGCYLPQSHIPAHGSRVAGRLEPACSQSSHADLKSRVRAWMEAGIYWPSEIPGWLESLDAADRAQLEGWIATKRPWPKTSLVLGECCFCHSTLAVCGDCAAFHEEGLVEVRGREASCECVRSDAWEAA